MKSAIAFVWCPESRSASRRITTMVIVSAVGRLSASRRVRYRRFDCILICIPSVLMKLAKAYTGKPPPSCKYYSIHVEEFLACGRAQFYEIYCLSLSCVFWVILQERCRLHAARIIRATGIDTIALISIKHSRSCCN